jgi:putative heme transporter
VSLWRSRWARRGFAGAIVLLAFLVVLPRLADYGEVWGQVRQLGPGSIAALAVATVLNLVTFGPPLMAALPGIGFRRAFIAAQASTASTYVAPGGAAVGIALMFVLLRRTGFRGAAIGLAVALTGLWNQLAMLSFPALALGLLTLTGGRDPLLQTVGALGLVLFVAALGLFALALASHRVARRAGELLARLTNRWEAGTLLGFRAQAIALLRRRWLHLSLATLAGQLTVFLVLLASLRTLGVEGGEVSLVEAFAAWSVVRLLGSLPLTPGGIGIVEIGLTTALVGFSGDRAEVVAAVLVYRFLTVVPTLVLGLTLAPSLRRSKPTV